MVRQSSELSLNHWQDFINGLPYKDLTVYLWGGEPLLFKGLTKLIHTIKDKGYKCALTTNGYLLKENAKRLVKSGLDYIEVSIDGGPSLHDKIRSLKGSFKKIEKGLRLLKNIKINLESLSPAIAMCSIISPYNVLHVESLFISAQNLGVEFLSFQPFTYVPTKYGKRYENIMQRLFNSPAHSWKGFEAISKFKIRHDRLNKVHSLSQKNWNYCIMLSPAYYIERINDYFNKYENNFGLLCQSPWNAVSILPDGKVTFCADFPDYILGDITTDSLNRIWNNKRARQFRRLLLEYKGLPICNRCCGLFSDFRSFQPSHF